MNKPTCQACPYYVEGESSFGECRRYPPTILSHNMFADPDGTLADDAPPLEKFEVFSINATQSPRVSGYEHWCGEHPDLQTRIERSREESFELQEMTPSELRKLRQRPLEDWMDCNGIPHNNAARLLMRAIADLYDEGLSLEQMMGHRRVRQKRAYMDRAGEFLDKWAHRTQHVKGYTRRSANQSGSQ